jgi:nucleotide-binding universal stress UspA family protein
MTAPILIAYDGTPHADDAIALARLLAQATGAPLELAHVHRAGATASPSLAPRGRAAFLRGESERVLARGAQLLGDPDVRRHAVAATTTATGLRELAAGEGALMVVSGSARDVPPGRAHPGSAARRLLQGAPCALAFAPAGFRERTAPASAHVTVAHDDDGASAQLTAEALAGAGTDLLVIGSRPDAPMGQVATNAIREQTIQASRIPILVVARGAPLGAGALSAA